MTKLIGSTNWGKPGDSRDTEISRCILSEDKLVMDFVYEARQYSAELKRGGRNKYNGTWSAQGSKGPLSCRLFRYDDEIFLFGSFEEDDDFYVWWSDLHPVDHFDDEQ